MRTAVGHTILIAGLLFSGCLLANAQETKPELGTVAGTVVDPQDMPIPGVQITLTGESGGAAYNTTTDCSGQYRVEDLDPDIYQVKFVVEHFRTETKKTYVCPSKQVRIDAELVLAPFTDGGPEPTARFVPPTKSIGWIAGTITDPAGSVIPNARIRATELTGERYEATTKSDEIGLYHFLNIPSGDYCVHLDGPPGFKPETIILRSGTTRNISLQVASGQTVGVCSASCPILIDASVLSTNPDISLGVQADKDVIAAGSSLWLSITLTNITSHPILIRSATDSNPVFAYDIYASDHCGCPGLLRRSVAGKQPGGHGTAELTVPPGGTLTDRVDLAILARFNLLETYRIAVERPDSSGAADGEGTQAQPIVRSKPISVRVISPTLAEACK